MTATERLPASLQRLLDAALDERAKSEQQAAELAEFNATARWEELCTFVEKDLRAIDLWEHAKLERPGYWCGEHLKNLNSHHVTVYLPNLAPIYLTYQLRWDMAGDISVWERSDGFEVQTGPTEDDTTMCPDLRAALLAAFDAARKLEATEIPY